ncbi:helix-hairpin-helix domain-containing protein [Streptomyces sp. YIM S03343]
MAHRSRTSTCSTLQTVTATSGPGRAPGSDGRARHRRSTARGPLRRDRRTPATALQHRAELLFPERVAGREALAEEAAGSGPPGEERCTAPPDEEPGVGAGPDPVPRAAGWRERAGLAVRERLPLWVQTRCGVERRSVIALTVLLVVAVAFAVHHYRSGRTQPVRVPQVVRAEVPYESGEREGTGGTTGPEGLRKRAAPGTAGSEIVVDVTGRVRSPGIRHLPAGSRVVDALRAAGGVRPGTDTDALNRARFLSDGEQLVVGGPAPAAPPEPLGEGAAGGAPAGTGGLVSLNTATAEQFNTLPGVGPVLAQHIIDYRTRHGGFRSVDELRQVNGIGTRRFADLRELVRP